MASIRLALYQPDIPQNTGALLRTAACLGVPVEIIEPCGFVFDEKRMRRAGMDYLESVALTRHAGWSDFQAAYPDCRRILLTTRAESAYTAFRFAPGDILLTGRESAGVPDEVHTEAQARIAIPMAPELRSLNLAAAAAMVLGEALRQLDAFPGGNT